MGQKKLSEPAIAELFVQNSVRQFGVPSELVHEQDLLFVAMILEKILKSVRNKYKHFYSIPSSIR